MTSTDLLGLARLWRLVLVATTAICCMIFVGATAMLAGGGENDVPKPEEQLRTLFGGELNEEGPYISLIKNAESATAYRVEPRHDPTAERSAAGWPIVGDSVTVDGDLVQELRNVLLDANTYGWDAPGHFCGFSPGVAIRYQGKDDEGKELRVVLLLCFTCDDVAVFVSDRFGNPAMENITPGRAKLIRLVKRLFPNDKEIQELVEERPEPQDEVLTKEENERRKAAEAQERAENLFFFGLDAVLSPAKVEAYRIGPDRDPTVPGRLNGHRVLTWPVNVDGRLSTDLAKLLVDGRSYDWQATDADDGTCLPRPSVVFIFAADGDEDAVRTAVYVCFSCDEIAVVFRHSTGKESACFRPARATLTKLASVLTMPRV